MAPHRKRGLGDFWDVSGIGRASLGKVPRIAVLVDSERTLDALSFEPICGTVGQVIDFLKIWQSWNSEKRSFRKGAATLGNCGGGVSLVDSDTTLNALSFEPTWSSGSRFFGNSIFVDLWFVEMDLVF